jgi:hypothetical protein
LIQKPTSSFSILLQNQISLPSSSSSYFNQLNLDEKRFQ